MPRPTIERVYRRLYARLGSPGARRHWSLYQGGTRAAGRRHLRLAVARSSSATSQQKASRTSSSIPVPYGWPRVVSDTKTCDGYPISADLSGLRATGWNHHMVLDGLLECTAD